MATKQTSKVLTAKARTPQGRDLTKHYSRGEILESLAYELKPFVLAAAGFGAAIYFTHVGLPVAKYFSLTIMGCGIFILYARAKDRGVIS